MKCALLIISLVALTAVTTKENERSEKLFSRRLAEELGHELTANEILVDDVLDITMYLIDDPSYINDTCNLENLMNYLNSHSENIFMKSVAAKIQEYYKGKQIPSQLDTNWIVKTIEAEALKSGISLKEFMKMAENHENFNKLQEKHIQRGKERRRQRQAPSRPPQKLYAEPAHIRKLDTLFSRRLAKKGGYELNNFQKSVDDTMQFLNYMVDEPGFLSGRFNAQNLIKFLDRKSYSPLLTRIKNQIEEFHKRDKNHYFIGSNELSKMMEDEILKEGVTRDMMSRYSGDHELAFKVFSTPGISRGQIEFPETIEVLISKNPAQPQVVELPSPRKPPHVEL